MAHPVFYNRVSNSLWNKEHYRQHGTCIKWWETERESYFQVKTFLELLRNDKERQALSDVHYF